MRAAQIRVFPMVIRKYGHLRRVGCIAGSTAGEHVVLAVAHEMRGSLTRIGRAQPDEMLGEGAVRAEEIVGQFRADHLPVWTFEPHVSMTGVRIHIHIEIPHAETLGLEGSDQGIGALEAVCLQDHEIAVGGHAFDPADPLAGIAAVEDMGPVERLGIVQRGEGILLVGRDDQAQVFPVVEVCGLVGADAPGPDIGSPKRVLLVLAVPIIGTVLLENLESVGLDGLAGGVQPDLAGLDAVIVLPGLRLGGNACTENGKAEENGGIFSHIVCYRISINSGS